jgi:hypothetical protein
MAVLKTLGSSSVELVMEPDKVSVAGVTVENIASHSDFPNLDRVVENALAPGKDTAPVLGINPDYLTRFTNAKIGRGRETKNEPLRLYFKTQPTQAIGVRFSDYFVGAMMPVRIAS